MSKTFALEIVTPERPVVRAEVEKLVVPSYKGELGILARHTPLLAQLLPGEIRMTARGRTEFLAVSGGFVEVHSDRVELFAETAEMSQEINLERARQAAERAKRDLTRLRAGDTGQEVDLRNAEAALRRAMVRLRVARHPVPARR